MASRGAWRARVAAALGVAAAAGGCRSPLEREAGEDILRERLGYAIEHQLESLPPAALLPTTQPPAEVERALEGRRAELDAIGPRLDTPPEKHDLGPDLTGAPQQRVSVNLRSAVVTAVGNNLSIQVARLQPAINEADVAAAEAAFDAVFVAGVDLSKIDEPTPTPVIGGVLPIGTPASVSDQARFATGVRKPLTTGGEIFVATEVDYLNNRTPGFDFFPDPSHASAVRIGLTQPLLRGFGASVNTATIRLSRNLERSALQQLRLDLLGLLADTEGAYWDLVLAWHELTINEWLVEVGIQVRDVMERRRDFDTRLAEYSDAVARVEERRGDVIAGRRLIRAASDRLKGLMNDPELSVGSEALLVAADTLVDAPIRYDLREAITTAIGNRPEIQQAILAIDDATVRQELADNERLPLLNLSAEMAYFGLEDSLGDSYSRLGEGNFIDYLVGLAFEWPIGNRAAEAGYRRARLERSASVIAYQRAVQDVVLDVKAALRNCVTAYELIHASRSSRIAQAENLRALLVEEETLAGLTPEFLNLKFQRQERLAQAQSEEVRSLAAYNRSVAELYRALGIGLAMNRIELEVDVAGPDATGAPRGPGATGGAHDAVPRAGE